MKPSPKRQETDHTASPVRQPIITRAPTIRNSKWNPIRTTDHNVSQTCQSTNCAASFLSPQLLTVTILPLPLACPFPSSAPPYLPPSLPCPSRTQKVGALSSVPAGSINHSDRKKVMFHPRCDEVSGEQGGWAHESAKGGVRAGYTRAERRVERVVQV